MLHVKMKEKKKNKMANFINTMRNEDIVLKTENWAWLEQKMFGDDPPLLRFEFTRRCSKVSSQGK